MLKEINAYLRNLNFSHSNSLNNVIIKENFIFNKLKTGHVQVLLFRFNKTEYPLFYLQSLLKDAFKNIKKNTNRIEIILEALNEKLYQEFPSEVICRAVFFDINEIKKELVIINRGFSCFYYLTKDKRIETCDMPSFPLGVVSSNKITIKKIKFPFNQFKEIILITDVLYMSAQQLMSLSKKIIASGNEQQKDKQIKIVHSEVNNKEKMGELKKENYFTQEVICESKLSFLYTEVSLYEKDDLLSLPELLIKKCLKSDNMNLLLTVLKEAFNNALEHGVLNLESKIKKNISGFSKYYKDKTDKLKFLGKAHDVFIKLNISQFKFKSKQYFCVMIQDSGPGFNYLSRPHKKKTLVNYLHGRGLMIIKGMATQMFFNRKANIIFIII